jgi:hypothetical protein
VGGRGQAVKPEKTQSQKKNSKTAQNPTRRLHALLGAVLQSYFLFNDKRYFFVY